MLVKENLSRGQVRWSGCKGGVCSGLSAPTLIYLHCARLPGDRCASNPPRRPRVLRALSSLRTALHSAGASKCFLIKWMMDGWMNQ